MAKPFVRDFSPQQRADLVGQWQTSNISKSAFARDAGINYNTFKSWIRQFSLAPNPATAATSDEGTKAFQANSCKTDMDKKGVPSFVGLRFVHADVGCKYAENQGCTDEQQSACEEGQASNKRVPLMEVWVQGTHRVCFYEAVPVDFIRSLLL